MATRSVVLTERESNLVEELVYCRRFKNISEVLREGFGMLEQVLIEEAARLDPAIAAEETWIPLLPPAAPKAAAPPKKKK